jgi:hypothetical protein
MIFKNRYDCKKYKNETIIQLLKDFFHLSNSGIIFLFIEKSTCILDVVISEIRSIREEFLKYDIKGSLNSSIVIVYDDIFFDHNNDNSKKEETLIKVKLIDFDYFGKDQELKDQMKDEDLLKKLELNNTIDPLDKISELFENFKTE